MRVEAEVGGGGGEEIYDPRSRGRTFLALLFRAGLLASVMTAQKIMKRSRPVRLLFRSDNTRHYDLLSRAFRPTSLCVILFLSNKRNKT